MNTVFLTAPAGYTGGSLSIEGHQYPIEEAEDDHGKKFSFVEIEQPFVDRALPHGFTHCTPPKGRRSKPEIFHAPVVIPASWEPETMTDSQRRVAEFLVARGFSESNPPTPADGAMAADALGITLDTVRKPVPDALHGAEGAGRSALTPSPGAASGATGAALTRDADREKAATEAADADKAHDDRDRAAGAKADQAKADHARQVQLKADQAKADADRDKADREKAARDKGK